MMKMKEKLLALIYPVRAVCQGCMSAAGHERGWLCEACREKLARSWIGASPVVGECQAEGAAFAYAYGGPAGGLVRSLKYRGVRRLGEFMATDMVRALEGIEPVNADMVVPVPMHPKRRRQRLYNHAEILADHVAQMKDIPMCCALKRVRMTTQQALLSGEERRHNLNQSIKVDADVSGKTILLVDDVYTTGATAAACEKALRQAGAKHVYLLCYALAKQ